MLITRSVDKPAQQSHNIGNVASGAINNIHEAANDACIFGLFQIFTGILK